MGKNSLPLLYAAEVVYSPQPREIISLKVLLEERNAKEGMSVEQTIVASGLLKQFPDLNIEELAIGIWGRRTILSALVRAGDRVEIYRELTVDPMEARRRRQKTQGSVKLRRPKRVKKS